MAQKNKQCLACRTAYSYCPSCSRADALAPSWKSEFCCETCKDVWDTLVKFNMNMLAKSEAKELISALDLKPIESYVACIQRDYAKIMIEEKKPKKVHKKFEPVVPVMEPVVIEEPVEVVQEHEVVLTEDNKAL